MNLVLAEPMRIRLGLPDTDEVTTALDMAIAGTTPYFESVLQTKFDSGERTDIFDLTCEEVIVRGGYIQLKLSNGFVVSDSVSIKFDETPKEAILGTVLPIADCFVHSEIGMVRVPSNGIGNFMAVTYTYGFSEGDELPQWVTEAAFSYAARLLAVQQLTDGKSDVLKVTEFYAGHCKGILDRHLRISSFALPALF